MAVDHHLTLQFEPDEEQADPVVFCNFIGLATAVIGEEHEPVLIKIFQQHGALAWPTIFVDRGQDHGCGIGDCRFTGLIEPGRELIDGIRFEI